MSFASRASFTGDVRTLMLSRTASAKSVVIYDSKISLSPFFDDERDLLEKTTELFKKHDVDNNGVLCPFEAKNLFSEALGCEKITLDEFDEAFRTLDRDIITNIDMVLDLIDCVGWLRIFTKSIDVQKCLKENGGAAALLLSAHVANALELKRLKSVLKKMSPVKNLLCPALPSVYGSNPFDDESVNEDPEFTSQLTPLQLRCLALVSHNNMKASMREFVVSNKNLLKKFRLTGTNSTMTMLREVFGDDPTVVYGITCKSGPLGGDAELVAAMCRGELGGMFFFQDPMESHMHSVDIDCLNRQALIYNVMTAFNPTSAMMMTEVLRTALIEGRSELIPSFIFSLECPTVAQYKRKQKKIVESFDERDAN